MKTENIPLLEQVEFLDMQLNIYTINHQFLLEEKEAFLVVHGGTIMAVLDRFSEPHRDYYDWQIRNGEGFQAEVREEPGSGEIRLKEIRRI